MTDERDQRQWRRPQPGDGPELRPRPYQSATQPPAAPTESTPSESTGVWKPSWEDDSDVSNIRVPKVEDPVAKHYYVPPRSQRHAAPPQASQHAQPPQPGSHRQSAQPPMQPSPPPPIQPPPMQPPPMPPPMQPQPRHGRHHDPEATDHLPRVPPPPPTGRREPELLTHREPLPPRPPQQYARPGGQPVPDGDEDQLTPEEAAALKRRKIWRRVRRISYAGAAGLVLGPILVFLLGYWMYEVPNFTAIVNSQRQPVTIFYADGTTQLSTINPPEGNRINVKHDDIPKHVREAVLAAEDRSFYSNPGFDAKGIARAAWKQVNGEAGGGSGITQQYVKVATEEDEFTLKRKFKEVVIATKISRNLPKETILENYLNIIYFGRQAYGIEAASQAYFGKSVKDLNVSEGALLAGMIQSPSKSDPLKNPERATSRWNFVLDGMVSQGWLAASERPAIQFPAVVDLNAAGPGAVVDYRRHIQDQILDELAAQGIDQAAMNRFGGRIVTTIQQPAQEKALEAITQQLEGKPENLHAALVAVDPKTGAVRAYFGGHDGTGYDLAGGTPWQPGSAFKPFAALAGLEQDIGLGATYPGNGPIMFGDYKVDNSESADYPELSVKKAMTYSVNTAFVALTKDVGPTKVAEAAYQAGIPKTINDKQTLVDTNGGPPGLSIALGTYAVRPFDMAAAYASFASQGIKRTPYFVEEYIGADGQSRYKHVAKEAPAFDPANGERNSQLACNVTESLTDVAAYSKFPLAGSRASAVKTGTAQRGSTGENANTWTVGYTPSISTAVWIGDPAQTALKLGNRNIFGATVAGPIWKSFMDGYLADAPKETFPKCKPIGKEDPTTTVPPPTTTPPPTTEETTKKPEITLTRPPRPTTTEPTSEPCGGFLQPPCPTTTTKPGNGGGGGGG